MPSEDVYNQVKALRIHGSNLKYYHKVVGGNFRIDALQAGVVLAKLKYLDQWTEKRRKNAGEPYAETTSILVHHPSHNWRSRLRYWIASLIWAALIFSLSFRSAMVRETFRMRS